MRVETATFLALLSARDASRDCHLGFSQRFRLRIDEHLLAFAAFFPKRALGIE